MEKLLYNLSIFFYQLLIRVSSLFNKKARQWIKGRQNIFQRLEKAIGKEKSKIAWFHCASLGEFEQGRPVLERFKYDFPNYKILLTFFSPSGYEIRKNYKSADYIFYLPADTAINASKFLNIVKPTIVFFIKYEFWYHFIRQIKKRDIPLISISAIFREDQLFFKSYGKFYRNILHDFDHIFVQNENSKSLLESINYKSVTVGGDTRFDRVKQIAGGVGEVPIIEKFKNKEPLIVAGSTWPADMEIIISFINRFSTPIKLVVAPHEIHKSEIEGFLKRINKRSIKYSEVSFDNINFYDVLVIDNIGMLSSLYKYGEYAYIGGGFGKGIHNILEAVVRGVPVFFGPNYSKFKEANDLIGEGVAFSVNSSEEFELIFERLYSSIDEMEGIKEKCFEYIERNSGATAKIIDYCKLNIR